MLNPRFEEDLALKHSVISSHDQKPSFNWRGVIAEETPARSPIRVVCPHGDEDFDLKEVIDTVGKALTNVLVARDETEIFTEQNQRWVERIAREVGASLETSASDGQPVRVALNDLYTLIERTLVENNAWDVAKSILVKSRSPGHRAGGTHAPGPLQGGRGLYPLSGHRRHLRAEEDATARRGDRRKHDRGHVPDGNTYFWDGRT
jgi:ribonucleoside-diphosphate reductase alpha chain